MDLLFWKREAFRHEEELRVVYVDPRGSEAQTVMSVSCDVKQLFNQIMFDPRLALFELKEREEWVTKVMGYTGTIVRSSLYQRILYEGAVSSA